MEPISIALICAASFGAVVAISVFIRQLILSRDKILNDEAQRRAITQEAAELEKMREQMMSNQRYDAHYKMLGENKNAIIVLDTQIEDILQKKAQLVERYAQVTLKESGAIIDGVISPERKEACDRLKLEIDAQIKFYNGEIKQIQQQRTNLWDAHINVQDSLLGQEKSRNENLDYIYKQHSSLLEKIFIRHTDDAEHVAKYSIEAGTSSFQSMILAPIQFLMQYFNLSTGISLPQVNIERASRQDVEQTQSDANDSDSNPDSNPDSDEVPSAGSDDDAVDSPASSDSGTALMTA